MDQERKAARADRTLERRLAQHLRTHHAAIATHELRAMGFSKNAAPRLVDRGVLQHVEWGVYRAAGAPYSRENQLKCALLAVGPDAMLTRVSAAHHLGLVEFPPRLPQLAVPRKPRTGAGRPREVRRISNLLPGDVITVDRLACPSPMRTVIELAADAGTSGGLKIVRRALRQAAVADHGLPGRLTAAIEQRGPFRGCRILLGLLDEHTPDSAVTRSPLEIDFLALCRKYGLPTPATNVVLEGHEVDAAWLDKKVYVELDTYGFHGGVRSFESDRRRDADLAVAGYRGLRLTKKRLLREERFAMGQVRALLAATRS